MNVLELRYEALKRYRLAAHTDDPREKAMFKAEGDLLTVTADKAEAVENATAIAPA